MRNNAAVQTITHQLSQAEKSLRGGGFEPVTLDALVERSTHFATRVRHAMESPMALQRLHAATSALLRARSTEDLLPVIVDRAVDLVGADFACVQLHEPCTDVLRLVAQSGFDADFVARFEVVTDQDTPCGRTAAEGEVVVVADIRRDQEFVQIHPAATEAGVRSLQTTPIRDYAGRTIGVLSTLWRRPHRPSPEDMSLLDLFAGFAGDQLTRFLRMVPAAADPHAIPDGAIEAVARAVIAPLLTPPEPLDAEVRQARATHGLDATAPAPLVDGLPAFTEQIVSGLLAAALTLDSAKSMVPDGPAAERLSAASEVIDRMLHQVRSFMVDGQVAGRAGAAPLTRPTRQAPPEAG